MSEDTSKTTMVISVVGKPKSGKSSIVRLIADYLKNEEFDIEINWGLDGEPKVANIEDKLKDIARRSKIVIKEIQAPRTWDPSPE